MGSESKLRFIGEEAFHGTKLREIEIPRGVNSVGARAFARNCITAVEISSMINEIADMCFYYCESLSEIMFESTSQVSKISASALYGCAIREVKIPRSVEVIEYECFFHCDFLSEVTFER
jgi:hypothetical protein